MLSDKNSLMETLNIALVHDRLNVMAGAERVLFKLHDLYPGAPIYTAIAKDDLVSLHMPDAQISPLIVLNYNYSRLDIV